MLRTSVKCTFTALQNSRKKTWKTVRKIRSQGQVQQPKSRDSFQKTGFSQLIHTELSLPSRTIPYLPLLLTWFSCCCTLKSANLRKFWKLWERKKCTCRRNFRKISTDLCVSEDLQHFMSEKKFCLFGPYGVDFPLFFEAKLGHEFNLYFFLKIITENNEVVVLLREQSNRSNVLQFVFCFFYFPIAPTR